MCDCMLETRGFSHVRIHSYFPVHINDACHCLPDTTIRCKDCDRYGSDFACMTTEPNDPVFRDGHFCGGFIDKREIAVEEAIRVWKAWGFDYRSKIDEITKRCEK